MKVLIVGGYGVFGARLARLLRRDGHGVCIAGRDVVAAQRLADEIGASALRFDRAGNLQALADFDVVVDAAGPFQCYGSAPYRLARAAIAAKVHYLDLADDAGFCAGIAALDAEATRVGVCVVSGLSSVPALSSAAVRALARDDPVRTIDTAILPGNRSPRGLSVMQSILTQSGRPMQVWRGGRWERVPGWSGPARYRLPDGIRRQGWQIEVPDTRLFPAFFGADTVLFRAGLELWIMRYGLAVFALLRRVVPFPVTRPVVRMFKLLADLLSPFGSGRGGMSVTVCTGDERRTWRLLAQDGDGPFIPAVPIRALLRRDTLPVGARPALCVVTLDEAEAAMADLAIRTDRRAEPVVPMVRQMLGKEFASLPDPVRVTHLTFDRSNWTGRAEVTRGRHLWSRLVCTLFRFPHAGCDVPVTVTKTITPQGETWVRNFDGRQFRSQLSATRNGMTERFGPFTFLLGLRIEDGALHYPVRTGRFGAIPLPRWLLPRSEAREYADSDTFRFDVALYLPITGTLLIRYRGYLTADASVRSNASQEMVVHGKR